MKTNVEKQGVIRDDTEVHLLCNKWKCKDGTILISKHRHDYVGHTDANGEFYFVDGGIGGYIRHSGNLEPMLVYTTDSHEVIRENFVWGSRGLNGDDPVKYNTLNLLTEDHIRAIISTQTHLPEYILNVFKNELTYRSNE